MSDRLVTIASFATPLDAHLAKNRLEADGIRAALEAETTSSMAWYLTNAIGGVKLLVFEQDAEQAVTVLEENGADEQMEIEEHFEDDWGDPENSEDFELLDESTQEITGTNEDHDEGDNNILLTTREENADRAFRSAVLGILLFPLQFCTIWLLVKILFSREQLNSEKRKRAILATVITVISTSFTFGYFYFLLTIRHF